MINTKKDFDKFSGFLLGKLAEGLKEKGLQINEEAYRQSMADCNHEKSITPDYKRGKKMVRQEIELQHLGKKDIIKQVVELCLLSNEVVVEIYDDEKLRFELLN